MRRLGDEPAEPEASLYAARERDPARFARDVEEIREAVRSYRDSVSLREAAREVGMSPTGLSHFCDGTEPYLPTLRKLQRWYQAHRERTATGGEA